MGDIRITGLHGIFFVEQNPEWEAFSCSLFTYIVVVNAMNLIDGVDGLAAGVGFFRLLHFLEPGLFLPMNTQWLLYCLL